MIAPLKALNATTRHNYAPFLRPSTFRRCSRSSLNGSFAAWDCRSDEPRGNNGERAFVQKGGRGFLAKCNVGKSSDRFPDAYFIAFLRGLFRRAKLRANRVLPPPPPPPPPLQSTNSGFPPVIVLCGFAVPFAIPARIPFFLTYCLLPKRLNVSHCRRSQSPTPRRLWPQLPPNFSENDPK